MEERFSRVNGNGRVVGGFDELDNQLCVFFFFDNLLFVVKEERKGNLMKYLKIFIGNFIVIENLLIFVQLFLFD